MMAADILLGSVYFEEATGDDTAADIIQITFQGGAAGTTLDIELTVEAVRYRVAATVVPTPFFNPARKVATPPE